MRLSKFTVRDQPPIRFAQCDGLSDFVVVAGANGVGKTRLIGLLMKHLRNPESGGVSLVVDATSADERELWGKAILDTAIAADAELLKQSLRKKRPRSELRGSAIYFESDRTIGRLQPLPFSWEITDPGQEELRWDQSFNPMKQRWQDTFHALQRLVEHQSRSIADRARLLQSEGATAMDLDFVDPLAEFQETFRRLVGPKQLVPITGQSQSPMYTERGIERQFSSLSSGEQEVVNIAFDFQLRKPSDSIVFFDEPELHLHPELAQRLLGVLTSIGERNQFVIATHSPEIITSSLRHSVVFLRPDDACDALASQTIIVSPDSDEMADVGRTLGVVSLGKRIVLLEGADASADKLLYSAVVPSETTSMVLLPCGGREEITSFAALERMVISKSIWGVDFFMLCDGDGVGTESRAARELQDRGRFKLLPRYHVENYFLDGDIWSRAFSVLEEADSWLRDPRQIEEALLDEARRKLPVAVSRAVGRDVRRHAGNVSLNVKGANEMDRAALLTATLEQTRSESVRLSEALASDVVEGLLDRHWSEFSVALDDGTWKKVFPGKLVFGPFAARARLAAARAQRLYVDEVRRSQSPAFDELRTIFSSFAES